MYSHCINLKWVKERFLLFVSFDFSPKMGRKIEEKWLTEQIYHRGAILFSSHPVVVNIDTAVALRFQMPYK